MDLEFSDILAAFVQSLDQWTAALADALSGADLAAAALVGCLPILLAVLSRSPLSLLAAALLVLLAFLLARGNEPSLALALYVAGCLTGLNGFAEARRRRAVRGIAQELSALHSEMSAFLTALDRRSQTVDEARLRLAEPKLEQE